MRWKFTRDRIFLVGLFACCVFNPASACSCATGPVSYIDMYAGFVAVVEVSWETEWLSPFNRYHEAHVLERLKGDGSDVVRFWSGRWSCGRQFVVGERYVILLSDGFLGYTTGMCTSWQVGQKPELLEQLREFYATDH